MQVGALATEVDLKKVRIGVRVKVRVKVRVRVRLRLRVRVRVRVRDRDRVRVRVRVRVRTFDSSSPIGWKIIITKKEAFRPPHWKRYIYIYTTYCIPLHSSPPACLPHFHT